MRDKIRILQAILMLLTVTMLSCKSIEGKISGVWEQTARIDSDDPYASRKSLKQVQIDKGKTLILNGNGTFISNLQLCNEEKPILRGIYFKKNTSENVFQLKCNNVYSDHYFILRGNKLELYYPTVTGHKIGIFERKLK